MSPKNKLSSLQNRLRPHDVLNEFECLAAKIILQRRNVLKGPLADAKLF